MGATPPRVLRRPGRVARLGLRSLLALAFGLTWFVYLSPTGLGGPVGLVWVSGTSMEPSMHTGDLAVMYRQSDYAVDDVVAFEIPGGGTVIHRIIAADDEGYRFQGDNRDFADPWVLDDEAVVGRRITHIPNAGTIMTTLGQPWAMAVAVSALALLWRAGRESRPKPVAAAVGRP